MATVMGADSGVKPHEANQLISDAVELLVQIGILHEVRRVIAISNVSKDLKNGDVYFESIYQYKEESSAEAPKWINRQKVKFKSTELFFDENLYYHYSQCCFAKFYFF